jgi:tellurite resistance-related uncharacterized protein
MFMRWLSLWAQTTDELLPHPVALEMQAKARRIGERLASAMHGAHSVAITPERFIKPTKLEPYRVTPEFDEVTVPAALKQAHSTKAGVWGIVRILTGRLLYHPNDAADTPPVTLTSANPGLIRPEHPHHLELLDPVRFQVEFYDRDPSSDAIAVN